MPKRLAKKVRSIKAPSTFKDDLIAGLIVAIVALPLAIGFSIASGVPPAMGVYTAIIAGFIAALAGGSQFQVSGPTGAMVVVILSVAGTYGIEGMLLATIIAGLILIALGAMRMGKVIEYIPSPVIVGFTAGIATIIFFGQLTNFLGTTPAYPQGAEFLEKTIIGLQSIPSLNLPAVLLAIITICVLMLMPRINKRVPGAIIAVIITTALVVLFPQFFDVRQVIDIGAIPSGLPLPSMPPWSLELIKNVLPGALVIAALAAIESLLSAVVADGMTDTRHNPNKELIGQGLANIGAALFGGIPATGAIARTATSIRSGAKSKLAALSHAGFLLIFVLAIGPLAALIPLATLAGILMFVAFNMVEWERIGLILKTPLSDVAVMLTTFALTVLVDLTWAIAVGMVLAALLFMKRMSDLYRIEESGSEHDRNELVKRFNHPDISIYTINGPLFFGAAARFDQTVAETPGGHKPIKIIRMKYVPVIDATGLNFIESTWHKHRKRGGAVFFTSVRPDVMKVLKDSGIYDRVGPAHFFPQTQQALIAALAHAHRMRKEDETVTKEELERFDLRELDLQESVKAPSSSDADPVESVLRGAGAGKVKRLGKKVMHSVKHIKLGSLFQ